MIGVAQADVELLHSAPSTVAVSSTVDNAKIKPEHIVDGDLKTAWNSRTNDLVGSWVAFRVPAAATVATIKLTVGFATVDKKLGDLFTQNPRIKKVAVKRNKVLVGQFTLDPNNRAVQAIAIGKPGGDYEIAVAEIVPGSKKAWRETSISELEVWGTLPAGTAAKAVKPEIRIGSLDSLPALSKAECIKAAFPGAKGNRIGDEVITDTEELGLTAATTICKIEHRPKDETDSTVDVVAVTRTTKAVLGRTQVKLTNGAVFDINAPNGKSDDTQDGAVKLSAFPLTTTESALLVEAIQSTSGPFGNSDSNTSTLYRVSAKGLDAILTVTSTSANQMEGGSSNVCKIDEPALGAKIPKKLVLSCSSTNEDWHNDDQSLRGDNYAERKEKATWNGTSYDYTPKEP
jgi:hypothetical protein